MRQFLTAFLWTLKNCDICDNCNTNLKIPYFQYFKSFFFCRSCCRSRRSCRRSLSQFVAVIETRQ